jgi:hypothetical protein
MRIREHAQEDAVIEQIVSGFRWPGVRLEPGVHLVDLPAGRDKLRRQAVDAPLGARK